MLVKELKEFIEDYHFFDIPKIEFNGELFPFTIIGSFLILGPEQVYGEMIDQLEELCDFDELTTAVRMKVEIC